MSRLFLIQDRIDEFKNFLTKGCFILTCDAKKADTGRLRIPTRDDWTNGFLFLDAGKLISLINGNVLTMDEFFKQYGDKFGGIFERESKTPTLNDLFGIGFFDKLFGANKVIINKFDKKSVVNFLERYAGKIYADVTSMFAFIHKNLKRIA